MTNIVSVSFILMSLYFFFSSHPLILSMIILVLSFFCYMSLSQLLSSWVGMSLMLIFLGGMMIIFLYMTSLSSVEKFIWKKKFFFLCFLIFGMEFFKLSKSMFFFENLKELYIYEKFLLLLLLISFLILVLVLVVKISENFKGSLIKHF